MTDETLSDVLALLENDHAGSGEAAALVVMPPDSGEFIVGNRAGLLRLAAAAMRAAKGETQRFEKETWVVDEDLDWGVKGFKFDPLAHVHLPEPKPTGWKRLRGELSGYAVLLVMLAPWIIGLLTVGHWIGLLPDLLLGPNLHSGR